MIPRDDDPSAKGDDYRDQLNFEDALHWDVLIESSLIVPNPPADGWKPRPEDIC